MASFRCDWSLLSTENAPLPRSSHCISAVGHKVFVIGGENVARVPINSDVHMLDLAGEKNTMSWETVSTSGIPMSPRIAHAQAVVGSCIWIFGGRQGITMGEGPLNDLHCFDTATLTWSVPPTEPSSSPPPPRSFHKMVAIENILYVFGGCGENGRMSDFYSYDTISHVWSILPSSGDIAGRGGPSLAAVNTSQGPGVMVTAGYSGQENNDVHLFDINSKSWQCVVPQQPYRPRSVCPTAVIQQGRFVALFGGEVSTSDRGHEGAGAFERNVVCIDAITGQVCSTESSSTELPMARGWTEMCLIEEVSGTSSLLLFGGLSGNDEDPLRLNDAWKLCLTICKD